jgi:hypothetical protein
LDKTIADRKQEVLIDITGANISSRRQFPADSTWQRQSFNTLDPDYDPNRLPVAFSRYQVVAVIDDTDTYTKAVLVKSWDAETTDES